MGSLRGGWKALLKAKKRTVKKHVFKDQTSGIMDLVQTPSAYTAWQPQDGQGEKGYKDSAKTELLAAEKDFDSDEAGGKKKQRKQPRQASAKRGEESYADSAKAQVLAAEKSFDDDDGGPASFLQISAGRDVESPPSPLTLLAQQLAGSPPVAEDSMVAAAVVVLEQYARTFDSELLQRVARSRPDAEKLRLLWEQVREGTTDVGLTAQEQQAARWCGDFVQESDGLAVKAQGRRAAAAMKSGEAAVKRSVLQQEVAVRREVVRGLEEDASALAGLEARESSEAAKMASMLQQFREKVASVAARPSSVGEALGLVEGLAQESSAEVQDSLSEARARRQRALQEGRAGLEHAETQLGTQPAGAAQGQAAVAMLSTGTGGAAGAAADGEVSDSDALRARYSQMCRWTLEGIQARRRREQGERAALGTAVAVLDAAAQ